MATIVQRATGSIADYAVPSRSVPDRAPGTRPARQGISEWSDRKAGLAAAMVVAVLGVVVLLIIAGVVLYATSWGYAVAL